MLYLCLPSWWLKMNINIGLDLLELFEHITGVRNFLRHSVVGLFLSFAVVKLDAWRNCFVASASAVWTQFATSSRLPTDSVDNFETTKHCRLYSCMTTWILIDIDNFFNNDDIMTSSLKKLLISIKISVIKSNCLVSFKIVDRIHRQSSWASCELCSHRRRQRDKTVSSRRRCVLGITWQTISVNLGCFPYQMTPIFKQLPSRNFCNVMFSWPRCTSGHCVFIHYYAMRCMPSGEWKNSIVGSSVTKRLASLRSLESTCFSSLSSFISSFLFVYLLCAGWRDWLACSTNDREVVGSSPAGCGMSHSNRGPIALSTLGLGLLNPPSSRGR